MSSLVSFAMWSLVAAVLVWACILQLVSASTFDGLPRPEGLPDAPTKAYGKFPPAYISINQPADCDWYGFANANYAVDITERCLLYTFQNEILTEANTQNLRAYKYIKCSGYSSSQQPICYDYNWRQYYCQVGCFYLGNSSLTIPPITAVPSSPASPGSTTPGSTTPGSTTPGTSRGDAFLPPPSVVMVAALCAGALAAVGLRNRL